MIKLSKKLKIIPYTYENIEYRRDLYSGTFRISLSVDDDEKAFLCLLSYYYPIPDGTKAIVFISDKKEVYRHEVL